LTASRLIHHMKTPRREVGGRGSQTVWANLKGCIAAERSGASKYALG
jgi:hypothetical protein